MVHEAFVELLLAGDRTSQESGPHLTVEFLRRTIGFATQYAELENLLLGASRVAYSPVGLAMNLSITGDVATQGEALAAAERTRFKLPEGPILGVDRLIEDQGVKLIPRAFPLGYGRGRVSSSRVIWVHAFSTTPQCSRRSATTRSRISTDIFWLISIRTSTPFAALRRPRLSAIRGSCGRISSRSRS